ncbi:dTDP-4-dehydrorhamnose 3,5-epimerase [Streptosporangium sp. V21-05]|uniref:dTDP-4-dehydrorhamnose 3,5-epimerase n=1 Tax=Streptosporangium sp. V21-05 TaxID=3446115 RepID=UPI003F53DFCA
MGVRPLGIDGAWVFEPEVFVDERGSFHEWFHGGTFGGATGQGLALSQANLSVSRRGTVRGVHFADVPPGQAKYVKCVRGSVFDVVVDLRVGSPTFGRWESVVLDDADHRSVYVSEGLGHGFMALSDEAMVVYLCSEGYAPGREHGVDPFDGELAIGWPGGTTPLLSAKDATAPSLAEAGRRGLLPAYEECRRFYAGLRA